MTKLSFCAIVKNEENSLSKCLESVKNVVDEIIILDTGSTDNTVEIAQQLGAKVHYFQWCDDFAIARNEALKYVQGEWVLVLDADEVLNPAIVNKLHEAIKVETNLVVNLLRHEVGASQSPYSLVSRLFRRHPDIKFTRPYHALIDDSVSEILTKEYHWQVATLNEVAIFHYGYQAEAIASLDKYTRARVMMEKFLTNHPNDPYVCSKLGALYLQSGSIKSGIKFLKQGLKSNQAEPSVLFELYYSLGNAYNRQQDYERAKKQYQKAINQPILPKLKIGAYNNLGSLLINLGDFQAAQQALEAVLKLDSHFAMGYYNLGMLFSKMKEMKRAMQRGLGGFPHERLHQEAIAAYQKAIELNPNYAPAYQNLGVILYKSGYMTESIETFKQAIALYEQQNPQDAQELRQKLTGIGIVI
ncbi:MAG: glycosyltransferase [Xenococcaceae cyanobacterium MO_188.B29]|nr:glycosyltransferase [Xenococcaceae cyanobacterium MO_188.B29]